MYKLYCLYMLHCACGSKFPKFDFTVKICQFTCTVPLIIMSADFLEFENCCTVEPRFNEVAGDRPNLFVKWRVRYIKNLDITNLRGNDQNVRYFEVIVND